jgi:hypothetical protein
MSTARPLGRILAHGLTVMLAIAGCAAGTPTPTPAPPSPTPAGPTSFADWTARQGFGGSSGLGIIRDNLLFLVNRPSDQSVYGLEQDEADVAHLAAWLDLHPATACWTDYHTAVRDGLAKIADGYERLVRPDVELGRPTPASVSSGLMKLADDLLAMPAPAACP